VIVANGPPSWIASGLALPRPGLNPLLREIEKQLSAFSHQLSAFLCPIELLLKSDSLRDSTKN
jgi:hypothetical protein